MKSYGILLICSCLKLAIGGYDCIPNCVCEQEENMIADCSNAKYTLIPQPDFLYPLHIFHLENNMIGRLRNGEFELLSELQELYLRGNEIETIEDGAFNGLKSLQTLDLSRNKLSTMPTDEVKKLAPSLIWLSFSENNFHVIPDGISDLTNVEHLDISSNVHISDIPKGSLPPNLKELYMSQVSIKHMKRSTLKNQASLEVLEFRNCIESVDFENNFFDELTSLKYVDLSGCSCNRLPTNAFSKLPKLQSLLMSDCGLNSPPKLFSEDDGSGLAITPTVLYVNEDTTATVLLNPNVIWHNSELSILDLSKNPNVTIGTTELQFPPTLSDLRLGYTNIPFVSENLFKECPLIETLDLRFSHVETIAPGAFARMQFLSEVWLSGNPIDIVPEFPASLKRLDASETKIKRLTKEPLARLSNVLEANFSNSLIENILDYTFGHMVSMEKLDLSRNNIAILTKNTLHIGTFHSPYDVIADTSHLKSSLVDLILSNNKVSIIEARAFETHARLRSIDLQNNSLTTLQPRTFSGLGNLVSLNLNNNLIIDIPSLTFVGLRKLKVLYLENNKLKVIYSKTFNEMKSLRHLHLENNNIRIIHYSSIFSLQYLDISNNELSTFPTVGAENLREINAAENRISSFPPRSLRNMTKLRSFNISHSSLKYINYSLFKDARALNILDLTGNRISNFLDEKLPSLRDLYLGNNNINSMHSSSVLRSLAPNLVTLDLSHNHIKHIDPVFFRGLLGLKNLKLIGNGFLCDCNLVPMVRWLQNNTRIKDKMDEYTCGSPPDKYSTPIVTAVNDGLKCYNQDKSGIISATTYVVICVAIIFIVAVLVSTWCLCKRIKKRTTSDIVGLDGGLRMIQARLDDPLCCCFGNAYNRIRGRIVSEESRDLVQHMTSPIDKEAPIPL